MTATRPGRYVVLEGGEGVGKTTQVRRLGARLEEAGERVLVLREPGGDPFAEAGRALLLGPLDRCPEAESLMFNALRAQVLVTQVRPALQQGVWVLSDRSRLSTLAYQGYGHRLDLDWVRSLGEVTSALGAPDLEVVLVVDEAVAQARRRARGTTDRFEGLEAGFHQRVNEGYVTEAARLGLPVVDGRGSEAEVEARLWPLVDALR